MKATFWHTTPSKFMASEERACTNCKLYRTAQDINQLQQWLSVPQDSNTDFEAFVAFSKRFVSLCQTDRCRERHKTRFLNMLPKVLRVRSCEANVHRFKSDLIHGYCRVAMLDGKILDGTFAWITNTRRKSAIVESTIALKLCVDRFTEPSKKACTHDIMHKKEVILVE